MLREMFSYLVIKIHIGLKVSVSAEYNYFISKGLYAPNMLHSEAQEFNESMFPKLKYHL